MALAVILGSVIVILGSFLKTVLGDLISDEIRGLIARTPHWMLRLAVRRVTPSVREDLVGEWESVLYAMADDPSLENRPISLFVKQFSYSVGHLRTSAKTDRSFRGGRLGRDLLDSVLRQALVLTVVAAAALTVAIPPATLLICCIFAGTYVFSAGSAVLLYPLGVFGGAGLTIILFFSGAAVTRRRDRARRTRAEAAAARRAEEHAAKPEPVRSFVVPVATRVLERQASLAWADEGPLIRPFVRHLPDLNPQADPTYER